MKNEKNFTAAITVDQTPEEAFDAINNVRGWWQEDIEGTTDKLGGTFKFHYKDIHYSTHAITEFTPGKRVVWHVLNSKLNFVNDKEEWDNTDIVFDITKKWNKTEVCFTHIGLVPSVECYNGCVEGWSFFIKNSLRNLITKGQGKPIQKESKKEIKSRIKQFSI